ncbi:MAG TPA: TetR/AcrR family transcriptional regulator [Chloroflexia bacterium]|nr:TetR/AcrR family transcriptional regulator [Chloroflexia bacterium]
MIKEQERSLTRRQRILDAAIRVFTRKGYRDAGMEDIAAEAETSKGGVYFHFAGKSALFLNLLDRMAGLLIERTEAAIASEPDPVARADAAIRVVLGTFAAHRGLAHLFLCEALGAGPEFNATMVSIHDRVTALIRRHLDEAVTTGAIPPIDTDITALVWFGALNAVVTRWAMADNPAPLEDSYPALRALLLRSIGAPLPGGESLS